ncbi:MAG: CBS domain-containing protein [Cyclobacteriaceae bacterium]
MQSNLMVSDVMTSQLKTVSINQTLSAVKEIFEHHIFRHLPVMDGAKLVGIISHTDFEKILLGTKLAYEDSQFNQQSILSRITAEQAMTRNPFTVPPDTPLEEVSEIFSKDVFHAIPIVDHGELVGIVTNHDLLKHLLDYDPR